MLRRVPTRDEFLDYLRTQRQEKQTATPQVQPAISPVQRLSTLVNTSPTRVLMPNRSNVINRMLQRKQRNVF